MKLTFKDKHDFEILPKRIEELEAAIARDEKALSDPALYSKDFAKFEALTKAVDKARGEKEAAELRWLELAEMVEG
ncbi:ABC transporter C-terminal domain-containing protein [Sphingomonas sp. Leaf357]|uniref:ABC transporter C-terminal domain-containing protein n=1 Tax=Sphingomonas sp. Leaf357 TaxID=1736350 RepID=UPI003FA6AC85